MKILTLIPLWKRPEVVRFIVERLPEHVTPLFLISPEDPNYQELKEIIHIYRYIDIKNDPLGRKMNVGVKSSLQIDYDYLMNLGSDDVLDQRYFDEIQLYLDKNSPFFGYDSCFVVGFKNHDRYYLKNKCVEYPIGAGRMIRRDVVEQIADWGMYTPEKNQGMDGDSTNRIRFATGVVPEIIRTENPPITDYKTNTNINPIPMICRHMKKI
jgi:glycosyltransferase involved in cell wall biosynthesis